MLQTQFQDAGSAESGAVLERVVLFVAGGHRFGIAIERIREVIPRGRTPRSPGAATTSAG
jgi:chemotaxis signal transduction protein